MKTSTYAQNASEIYSLCSVQQIPRGFFLERPKEREAFAGHATVEPGGPRGTSVYSPSSHLLINLEIFTIITQHRAIIKPTRNRNMTSRDL